VSSCDHGQRFDDGLDVEEIKCSTARTIAVWNHRQYSCHGNDFVADVHVIRFTCNLHRGVDTGGRGWPHARTTSVTVGLWMCGDSKFLCEVDGVSGVRWSAADRVSDFLGLCPKPFICALNWPLVPTLAPNPGYATKLASCMLHVLSQL